MDPVRDYCRMLSQLQKKSSVEVAKEGILRSQALSYNDIGEVGP